ncbi:hypothetical protein BDA99DRAFT_501954 [Phascolomyces articulosus]|uniref:Uncharacterized protein n=1 Tax=Phascolomyces articulosus TaxID=60185 RepID=A0AAD5KGV4_9FUNG|nr:hypothetical protein BDA99DRAFT_501954 [Phascolomyces articulosus]
MTHLSDFSYLQRCCLEFYITAFLVHRIWTNEKFNCLRPSQIPKMALKSIITYLMIVMMCTQTTWDIISTWIKYKEGFIMRPDNGQIIQKPFAYWDEYHQSFVQPIDYVQCVSFSLQTGVFFLLQCFWNYLCNRVAKRSFMGSWEFKFYIVWALGSAAMFPVLQWRYSDDELLSEIVPQLAYGLQVLLTACLGVRSHFRFKRLLKMCKDKIGARLAYFRDMNVMLTIILTVYGITLVLLCADGLTEAMTINSNKLAIDLLIANTNMCIIFLWLSFISIFHPRKVQGNQENTSQNSQTHDPEESTNPRLNKFIMNDTTKQYNNTTSPRFGPAPLNIPATISSQRSRSPAPEASFSSPQVPPLSPQPLSPQPLSPPPPHAGIDSYYQRATATPSTTTGTGIDSYYHRMTGVTATGSSTTGGGGIDSYYHRDPYPSTKENGW